METMSKGKIIVGTVIGAVAGVITGLLMAPKSGQEIRTDLKAKADELKRARSKKKDGHGIQKIHKKSN